MCKPVPWLVVVLAAGLTACGGRSVAPVTDGPIASQDAGIRDARPRRDATLADGRLPADSTPPLCGMDAACHVINDCCSCWAIDQWTFPEQCLESCPTPVCDLFGFQEPTAVCIDGHCHLAEGKPDHCQSADDCTLFQDCCYCMAVPWTVSPAPCDSDCNNDACERSGMGLDKVTGRAHFTCFQGECTWRVYLDERGLTVRGSGFHMDSPHHT